MGLQAFGEPDADEIRRGVDFLLRTQKPDGSWDENETTGTGFPKVFYLKYDSYRNAWPLLALAEQRDLEKILQARNGKRKARALREMAGSAR